MNRSLPSEEILGVSITIASPEQILEFITRSLELEDKKVMITTPNPEIIVAAHNNPTFKKILNSAELALPDGVGLVWAARLLGKEIHTRITGADFVETLCEKLSKRTVAIGLLGGREGVAEKTAECLKQKYPGLKVSFALEEWPEEKNSRLTSKNKNYYKYAKAFPPCDILFVAYGAPRQEEWIYENLPHIQVKVAMTVGGTFDYISGSVSRAPRALRSLGLEWLYRLIIQPWRWKRQLALIEFIFLVLQEKFQQKS